MAITTLNMYVFLLAFAAAFLLAGRRPFLQLSTRALLVVLLGLALTFAAAGDAWYRSYAATATIIANVLFVTFAVIDYLNWQKKQQAAE